MSSSPYGSDYPANGPGGNVPGGGAPGRSLPVGLAVASLVLGILGIITSFILVGGLLGLLAVILGFIALGKAKRGEAGGRGLAIGGIVAGALALLLALVLLVTVGAFFARNSDEFSNLTDCLQAADDEQAEVACQEEFERKIGP